MSVRFLGFGMVGARRVSSCVVVVAIAVPSAACPSHIPVRSLLGGPTPLKNPYMPLGMFQKDRSPTCRPRVCHHLRTANLMCSMAYQKCFRKEFHNELICVIVWDCLSWLAWNHFCLPPFAQLFSGIVHNRCVCDFSISLSYFQR